MQWKSIKCGLQRTPKKPSLQWKEWMLVCLGLVLNSFFTIFVPVPRKQQTKHASRYDPICVQECPNFIIWIYGPRSKRFEDSSGSVVKIRLGLQATKRWDSRLHRKKIRAPGLWPPLFWHPVSWSFTILRSSYLLHACTQICPSLFNLYA